MAERGTAFVDPVMATGGSFKGGMLRDRIDPLDDDLKPMVLCTVPFFDEHEIVVSGVLTNPGTEYCGKPERHEYEFYLAIEYVDHARTRARRPPTNGICERFHTTLLDEFYRVAFRKPLYQGRREHRAGASCAPRRPGA